MPRCQTCGDFDLGLSFSPHRCAPSFECRGEWQDDECWITAHAFDAQGAAAKFAERYDQDGEYNIIQNSGKDYIVLVRKDDESPVERFAIEAESVPTYHAWPAQ